jgi:hypothetical protein
MESAPREMVIEKDASTINSVKMPFPRDLSPIKCARVFPLTMCASNVVSKH